MTDHENEIVIDGHQVYRVIRYGPPENYLESVFHYDVDTNTPHGPCLTFGDEYTVCETFRLGRLINVERWPIRRQK